MGPSGASLADLLTVAAKGNSDAKVSGQQTAAPSKCT
jgi:hypothetical protein